MLSEISTIWDLLWDIYEKTKGTAWEWILSAGILLAVGYLAVKFVVKPLGKYAKKLYDYIQKKRFVSKQFYKKLSFMNSSEVYEAINRYIPTRFSRTDPSNNDEPTPEYVESGASNEKDKAPLLLEQFMKYEYSVKYGQKYYLCLGDCGMGKTTFLLNLYYRTSKLKQYNCVFISLQESDYLEKIQQIENPTNTILMLDALDENDKALANYSGFITELERETADFCRVIITARTNFFENATKERLGGRKSASSMSSKISSARKYYIMPFTDEDIKQYLKMCYPFSRRKQKQAWNIIENNKNLSVRPMLLKFMNALLEDGVQFEYDFQLYEYFFEKWIAREMGEGTEASQKLYEECLLVAKAIYYQWMKNGRTGIYPEELENRSEISGLESVKLKGHALLNRTSDGMYKFSHKSYWEYLLAKLALSDVQFSNDLLIGNFDRAVGFLEEMIAYREAETEPKKPGEKMLYTRSGRLFTGHEASIGVANYLLKYKKPEDAEVIYKDVLAGDDCSEELRLFAMVKLAKSYWQQVKYKSAGRLLKEIDGVISQEEFREEWLYIYVEFAGIYATYSREFRVKAGQDCLVRLIAFYERKELVNYGLLRCYESYCCCCMNYKQKYGCLDKMKKVAKLYFQDDQYVEYLILWAESWKMKYSSENFLLIQKRMNEKYQQYMDSYEQLISICDTAIAVCAKDSEYRRLDKRQDEGNEYFCEGKRVVYSTGAYNLLLKERTVAGLSYVSGAEMCKNAEEILENIKSSNTSDEMNQIKFRIKKSIGSNKKVNLKQRKQSLSEALELADSIYWKARMCWSLWLVYEELGNMEESQFYLKKAYNYVTSDPDLYLNPIHSNILERMLKYYNCKLDKTMLVKRMFQILPEIYGNIKPEIYGFFNKSMAYEALADFYRGSKHKCLIDIYTGLLECEIKKEYLEALYDTCIRFQEEERFQRIVSTTVQAMEPLSKKEADCMEQFLQAHSQQLGTVVVAALRSILKAKQKESGGYRYDIF